MADVQVSFGANIQELVDGIDGIRGLLGGLAATLGAAFSVEGIENFIESMAELGSHIDRTAAILGISTTEVQELGIIAKATGGDAGSLTHAIGLLQRNLETAQSGIGPTAQALKALGLNAKELAALPIPEQMAKIADAFNKYADGGRKAALANELVRGGAETLLPAIEGGSAGFNKLKDAAVEAGALMTSETNHALDDLSVKGTLAKASLTALGGTLVGLASKELGDFSSGVATTASHLTALAATGNLADYMLGYLDEVANNLGYRFVQLGHAIANLAAGDLGNLSKQWAEDGDALLANAKTQGADLDAILNRSIDSYHKLLAAIKTDNRPQAPGSGAPDKSAITAQLEEYQTEIKLADEAFRQTQEKLGAELKAHEITYDQETQRLLDALEDRHGMELAANAAEAAVGGQTVAQYQKIADEKRQIDAKYAADHQKIVDQLNEHDAQVWKAGADQVASAINSQLRDMLSGHESSGQALKKISGDVAMKFIEDGIKWTTEEMANLARSLFTHTAVEDVKTAATAAGVSARTGIEDAGAAASLGTQIATAMSSIAIDLGEVFANLAAWLTAEMGPAGVPVALAATAGVGAIALSQIKHLDVGGYVLSPGLAMLHPGETVLPAQVNTPYRGGQGDGGGGGDTHVHFNVSAIDAAGVQRFFAQNSDRIARHVRSSNGRNPSNEWA